MAFNNVQAAVRSRHQAALLDDGSGSSMESGPSDAGKSYRLQALLGNSRPRSQPRTPPQIVSRYTPTRTKAATDSSHTSAIRALVDRLDTLERSTGQAASATDDLCHRVAALERQAENAAGDKDITARLSALEKDVEDMNTALDELHDIAALNGNHDEDGDASSTSHVDLDLPSDGDDDAEDEEDGDLSCVTDDDGEASLSVSAADTDAWEDLGPAPSWGGEEEAPPQPAQATFLVRAKALKDLTFHKGNLEASSQVGAALEGATVLLHYPMVTSDLSGETWCRTLFVDPSSGEVGRGWVMVQTPAGENLVGSFSL